MMDFNQKKMTSCAKSADGSVQMRMEKHPLDSVT